ncbi:MarR family transcriptional regulator, partial [Corynebacterium sanguinis]|nr:MarR family transcriptional regulator [Corynebacterium sanguinis]
MQLDPVIHPVGRLKICAALSAAGATEGDVRYEMRFAHLREVTGLSDT